MRYLRFITLLFLTSRMAHVVACPICIGVPQATLADQLFSSRAIVLADLHPQDRFAYAPTKVLKGDDVPDYIDLFVDSVTRNRLAACDDCAAILVREAKGDGWVNLGVADEEFRSIVERIAGQREEWNRPGGRARRFEFFASLLGHSNRQVFEQAYLELGRAPYATIKRFSGLVPGDVVATMLNDVRYFEWQPLAILVYAQRADDAERDAIRRAVEGCHRFSSTRNLAAWATAWIEIDGPVAIEKMEQWYLTGEHRTLDEVRAVATALSVYGGQADRSMQSRIVVTYARCLEQHPSLAALVARDLLAWDRNELKPTLYGLLSEQHSFSVRELRAIHRYLNPQVDGRTANAAAALSDE